MSPTFPDPAVLAQVLTSPAKLDAADVQHILSASLGGAVRARLPESHPLRSSLRKQAVDLALRHAYIRTELRPLLAAWAREGIPALLFKGFALAEFEYATPGERFYGDVDILLPEKPEIVARAAHIALAYGWRTDGLHAHPERWTHESMHLFSPGGHVRIDVHRWVVAQKAGVTPAKARKLTSDVWQRASRFNWDGIGVYRPAPLDAAVVNLALGRCWGGDSGGLKPADYLDLQVLCQNHQLSSEALRQHASEVGGGATWAAFQRCCSPEERRLQLDIRRTAPVFAQGLSGDSLKINRGLWKARWQLLCWLSPQLLPALLDVMAAWWAVRQGGDPRTHLARWTPPATPVQRQLGYRALTSRLAAVNWWTRLLYPKQRKRGVCVPRAYATYRSLRRAGHPAVFVSGAGRRGSEFVAHAWIEDDRGTLDLYGEPQNRRNFKVVFSYPEGP
ncbi:lasso peptide biosynthesis B2 protein [Deinococcus wulumuqiensis]|uniref:lasso peptide biosynthesis B2 protein n=1 Tax=Deinococcus wulumuqiensis TaxID=980427 RepID=UPI0026C3E1C2